MIVYAHGERWIAFTDADADAGTRRIERFARLETPATVVWQPAQTAVGLASFEGDARHAGVLIERRLRTEGTIETDTKIFIHHIESVGLTYQALYSTASLEEWQRMQHWASSQDQHCAWMLATTLAWSLVGPDAPVVLHAENAFQFFGRSGGRMVQANTLAFGTDDASLVYAARTLGERIREELGQGSTDVASATPTVRWACMATGVDAADAGAYGRVMAAFREGSGMQVVSEDVEIVLDGAPARSALPRIAARPAVRRLLNRTQDRVFLVAERYRLATAFAAIVLSVTFFAAAGQKALSANALAAQTRVLAARASEAQETTTVARSSDDDRKYRDQIGFVETLGRLQSGLDVADILQALKAAAGTDLRILAVRSEEKAATAENAPQGIVVDGVLQDDTTTPDSFALSSFVRSLSASGYLAEPLETRAAAAASNVSSRLFSYRLVRVAPSPRRTAKS